MFDIKVNGQNFTLWETVTYSNSIDENAGKFSFTASNATPADYPVKVGDQVQILIDGETRLTGFAEVLTPGMDGNTHTITIQGRDNTCDLIDSSVPNAAKNISTPVSMKSMCEQVISALGANINVVSDVVIDNFTGEILASSGQLCMDFLTSFARKRQVYLIASGSGDLRIFRPGNVRSSFPIIHRKNGIQNNVKSYSAAFRQDSRFGRYQVTSQDNFSDDSADYKSGGVNRNGSSVDSQIRTSRYLEIQGEESMSDAETQKRADEEANIRRARAIEYSCTLQGANYKLGELVDLLDEFAGLQGVYLVRSLSIEGSIRGGTVTNLTLALPDAYNVVGDLTQSTKRKATTSRELQNETPPTSTRFVR